MSTLEARLERLEKVAGPADEPCFTVNVEHPDPHLLTDGKPAEETSRPRKRSGHKCGEGCVRVSISYSAVSEGTRGDSASRQEPPEADAVGAHSGSGRGDVQRLPESAAVGRDVEPHSGPPRSPPPAYGPEEGSGEVVLGGRARDTVVEVRRDRVSVPLGAPSPQLGPEDAVEVPPPHGNCGLPFCRHPLEAHRCYTERLPCRYCGWPVTAHDGFDPGLAFGLAYASRRAMTCGVYLSIAFEGGERDGCTVEGCGCPGWRLKAPYMTDREAALRLRIVEQDQIIAANANELARLRAEYEQLEREALRAQGPNDLGASPHSAPVFVEGESGRMPQ